MSKQQTAYDLHERIEELRKRRGMLLFGIRVLEAVGYSWLIRKMMSVNEDELDNCVSTMYLTMHDLELETVELMGKLSAMKVEEVKGDE